MEINRYNDNGFIKGKYLIEIYNQKSNKFPHSYFVEFDTNYPRVGDTITIPDNEECKVFLVVKVKWRVLNKTGEYPQSTHKSFCNSPVIYVKRIDNIISFKKKIIYWFKDRLWNLKALERLKTSKTCV